MVIALVKRGGNVRSFRPGKADGETVSAIVCENIVRESRLHTDESKLYSNVGKEFSAHETTVHSRGEYVRGDVHTNSVEGFFSIFKRGMRGVYQHGKEKHLHRYLAKVRFPIQLTQNHGYGAHNSVGARW
jgi:ISXO2-like transposase domain